MTAPCQVKCLHLELTKKMHHVQDAKYWYQRNKVEEGGGTYLDYGWDSSIWGVNLQLANLTKNSEPMWAAEVRRALPSLLRYAQVVVSTGEYSLRIGEENGASLCSWPDRPSASPYGQPRHAPHPSLLVSGTACAGPV